MFGQCKILSRLHPLALVTGTTPWPLPKWAWRDGLYPLKVGAENVPFPPILSPVAPRPHRGLWVTDMIQYDLLCETGKPGELCAKEEALVPTCPPGDANITHALGLASLVGCVSTAEGLPGIKAHLGDSEIHFSSSSFRSGP